MLPHEETLKIYPTKSIRIREINSYIKKTNWTLINIHKLNYLKWAKDEYENDKIEPCDCIFDKSNVRRYEEDVRNKNKER